MAGRYSVPINPRNGGLEWSKHFLLVPGKMALGKLYLDVYKDSGGDLTGAFTQKAGKICIEYIGDILPDTMALIRKDFKGTGELTKLLPTRASFCLPESIYEHGNGELFRLEKPECRSTWNAVMAEQRLRISDLHDLQEQRIIIDAASGPGLYIRWNIEQPTIVYVGITDGDLENRNRAHKNAPHYLCEFRSVAKLHVAKSIEKSVHKFLTEVGRPMRSTTRGLFQVESPKSGLKVVRNFLDKYYKDFFYNTCTINL